MKTYAFSVSGMSCGHCENAIREEVGAISGITAIDVSSKNGTLNITADQDIDAAAIIAAVDEAGYSAALA